MESETGKRMKGIRVRTLNYVMVAASAVLYVVLIYATLQVSIKYEKLIKATEDYIGCEADATLVRDGSDYLTEQVRLYAITRERQYMDAYIKEKNVTRRRERGLEDLERFETTQEAYDYLQKALDNSNRLMEREFYSMRLISEAQGYDVESLPEEVRQVVLLEEDKNLSPQEMIEKGQNIVFDLGYRDAKELIISNTDYFLNAIIAWTRGRQLESASGLEHIIWNQRICIGFLFVLDVLIFVLILVLIVKPLQIYIRCIKEDRLMELTGAFEFKYLAKTYNDIYEVNSANEALLRYKAEHDPLTGTINRGAFEQMRLLLKTEPNPIALLIIDVDKFKEINDSYGHETGDQVLKKVAKLIREGFREKDHVARIGGDEFAVIMTNSTPKLESVIAGKANMMNETLMNPEDGLPKVSLSIGVAFSSQGFSDELYRNADKALYKVKERGRRGYYFYDESD